MPNSMRSAAVAERVPEPRSAAATLGDLMTTRVSATTPETSVAAAAAGMVAANVGSAIVMQGSFLAGILTERDVLRAAASGEDLSAALVAAWMTRDPQSASPATSIEEAAQIMLLNGFRHLPVVDGRTVCGVVSLRDLFAARIRRPIAR
jgi:CBS domain-containing protein